VDDVQGINRLTTMISCVSMQLAGGTGYAQENSHTGLAWRGKDYARQ
jgi:hypothetical protein